MVILDRRKSPPAVAYVHKGRSTFDRPSVDDLLGELDDLRSGAPNNINRTEANCFNNRILVDPTNIVSCDYTGDPNLDKKVDFDTMESV